MVRPRMVANVACVLWALTGGPGAHSRAADDATPAALADGGANLDWAVDTTSGAWCTAPFGQPRLAAPLTIEGWFKPTLGESTAALIEISDVEAGRSWIRLGLDRAEEARAGVWTHFALAHGPRQSTLTTWDAERGERLVSVEPVALAGGTGPLQVCVGGSAARGDAFAGLADEVRIWAAEVPGAEIRAWRHRRVGDAHPLRPALRGYWPFRAGRGTRARDEGETGALASRAAVWAPLPRLDYGPLLRALDRRSVRFLFHARDAAGAERDWMAAVEVGTSPDLGGGTAVTPSTPARPEDDHVAHVALDGLLPQTRYHYAPLIDGRRGLDPGPGGFPSFLTLPDVGGGNADFTAVFLADQHVQGPAPRMEPYAAARAARPLFWAQLGDVAAGNLDGVTGEHRRDRAHLQGLWERNYAPGTPQAGFAARFGLNLATISDHEVEDNFSLNWHLYPYGNAKSAREATLHDRVFQYDRSLARWWAYFGWGDTFDDPLGRVARTDRGESVMAETPVAASADGTGPRACVDRAAAGAFAKGDFVSLADAGTDVLHTRVRAAGADAGCPGGGSVTLADPPARAYRAEKGATLAVGARYARPAHYRAWQPFPFVEFFVADTTSFRGDPYEKKDVYAAEANRDTDHARYPWHPERGADFIHGDVSHGANRTTDGVRSWLGPTQKAALLDALARSRAGVVVVAAGYPLYSAKFERSRRYWEGRESGFDFATEVAELLAALERLDRLVLWVHGDGHTPALVRLRRNVYQLQVGATQPSSDRPGHRSRSLGSGSRSTGDSLGGGYLIAGHQPDLLIGDAIDDIFEGGLDQFAGYLRLYFHPGQEALRSVESAGLLRGRSAHEVAIRAAEEPALGDAARRVVGRVVRLRFGDETRHSVVTAYRYEPGLAVLTLQDPVAGTVPDELRVLIDAVPWVEARWFDARGREWRDFGFVMRKDL